MNALCPQELLIDEDLHAGGMHLMPPGGWLDLHLDAERHPRSGQRRHTNLILFLESWPPDWGGALELWGDNALAPAVSIMPAAGRAVAFDCRQVVHGIPTPTNPFGGWRKSLAVFWYQVGERLRAQFLATPGGAERDKEHWRRERVEIADL